MDDTSYGSMADFQRRQAVEQETAAAAEAAANGGIIGPTPHPNPRADLPKTPFSANLLGFIETGVGLVKFRDKATLDQWKHFEDTTEEYFGVFSGENQGISYKPEEISVDMLVFAKWPPDVDKPLPKFRRCLIITMDHEKGSAYVKDVDEWLFKDVPFEDIYHIPPKPFLDPPFRVYKMKPKGLEFWCEGGLLMELTRMLPPLKDSVTINDVYRSSLEDDSLIMEIILKLNKSTRKQCLHQWAHLDEVNITQVFQDILKGFTRIPRVFTRGLILEHSHISHVDCAGETWISLHSTIGVRLSNIGTEPKQIRHSFEFNASLATSEPVSDFQYAYERLGQRRFLARFLEDRFFHRVEILSDFKPGDTSVKVHYIDYGNVDTIPVDDIMLPQLIDPILNEIHPQVFRGRMNGVEHVVDADGLFDLVHNDRKQRVTIAGFYPPNGLPLFDIQAKWGEGEENEGEWFYVNRIVVDKGLALEYPRGIIPYRTIAVPCTSFASAPPVIPLALVGPTPRSESNRIIAQKNRFYATCRLANGDDRLYAYCSLRDLEEDTPDEDIEPLDLSVVYSSNNEVSTALVPFVKSTENEMRASSVQSPQPD